MANSSTHIPRLGTISDFYRQLRIGSPTSDEFAVIRIEEEPATKRPYMPLFRCGFFRLVFFNSTGVRFFLGEDQYQTCENSLYFSYPGKVESWQSEGTIHGHLICFTAEFAQMDPFSTDFQRQYPFLGFEGIQLLRFDPSTTQELEDLFGQMLSESKSVGPDSWEYLRHLLHLYLIKVRRYYRRYQQEQPRPQQRAQLTYHRFIYALDHYFSELAAEKIDELPSVRSLAKALNLHPSYLNSLIKQATGRTASAIIHEKLMLEAKSYLLQTDLQVSEIGFKLGFSSASYFNRTFKKHSGQTPLKFRRQQAISDSV
ncbi:MAG: helix-turn-helix transcriptional regulator [Bacteroidota bacterium]